MNKLTTGSRFLPAGTLVHRTTYADGNTCLAASDAEGMPEGVLSVNLPETNINEEYVWIKDWAENEGVLNALIESKLVEDLNITQPTGFCEAHLVKLSMTG